MSRFRTRYKVAFLAVYILYIYIYIYTISPPPYNILAEAARLRRAPTAMARRKKRHSHDGISLTALP